MKATQDIRRRQRHLSQSPLTITPQCVMGVRPDLVTLLDLTWSHHRLVTTNLQVMCGHFPVFRVEICSPKPFAPRVQFKHNSSVMSTKSRFYSVKSNRSSHKAKKPHGRSLVQFGQSRHKSKLSAPRVQSKHFTGRELQCLHLTCHHHQVLFRPGFHSIRQAS